MRNASRCRPMRPCPPTTSYPTKVGAGCAIIRSAAGSTMNVYQRPSLFRRSLCQATAASRPPASYRAIAASTCATV